MPEPYCLAMVLCDHVHRDMTTGKATLLGTFSAFHPKQLPALVQFTVYAEVTDGSGAVQFELQVVDSRSILGATEEGAFSWRSPPEVSPRVEFNDPLMVLQMTFVCQLELPNAGLYHCELMANGELLMARRIVVMPPPTVLASGSEGAQT